MQRQVAEDDLKRVVSDVWLSLFELKTDNSNHHADRLERVPCYSSYVNITGVFNGGVFVQTTARHLRSMASSIFEREPTEIKKREIKDIIGELSNLIGGHVKSLLADDCNLSLPHVMGSKDPHIIVPEPKVLQSVIVEAKNEPIKVVFFRNQ